MPDLLQLITSWAGPLLARAPEPRTSETALRSEVRQRIMRVIEAEPGITLSQLRLRVGSGWGALYYQLRRLEESGLLEFVELGRRRVVVSRSTREPAEVLAAKARLRSSMAARVAELVAKGDARDASELAAKTGLSLRAVRYHVRRLIDAGLIASASRSRHRGLRPTPLLLTALSSTPPGEDGSGRA